MPRKKLLPDDVRQTCIQLVRGYDRRVRDYYDRRRSIIEGTACHHEVIRDPDAPEDWKKTSWAFQPTAHAASRTTESIAEQLFALEELPEIRRMRAVESAKAHIGDDLPVELKRKLTEAIWLNCKSGRRYPYKVLDVEGFSERGFYRARDLFLIDIAQQLELL